MNQRWNYYPTSYNVAKNVGCFQWRLLVCVVCQHDNFRTTKHRMMKLGGRCIVQKSQQSSILGVIAPRVCTPKNVVSSFICVTKTPGYYLLLFCVEEVIGWHWWCHFLHTIAQKLQNAYCWNLVCVQFDRSMNLNMSTANQYKKPFLMPWCKDVELLLWVT